MKVVFLFFLCHETRKKSIQSLTEVKSDPEKKINFLGQQPKFEPFHYWKMIMTDT